MNLTQESAVDRVRRHLKDGRRITPATALMVYGIIRLASTIEDLRAEGMEIDMAIKVDEMGKRYGEYKLRPALAVGDYVQIKRGHGYLLPAWIRKTKAVRISGLVKDVAYLTFTRGARQETLSVNTKELVHVS